MAIYYNLGVDCGSSESIANRVIGHFEGFQIKLPNVSVVEVSGHKEQIRGFWYVGVWPVGLSHASPMGDRPEITDDLSIHSIEVSVIEHLSKISGYRRAKFGGECYDQLARGEPEEDHDINYVGMIFSIGEFGSDPSGLVVERFSDGLNIVTSTLGH